MKQRKSYKDVKGKAQVGQTLMRPYTEALYDGGLSRNSLETPVMGEERRAEVIQLELLLTTPGNRGRKNGSQQGKYQLPNRWVGKFTRKCVAI